MSAARGLADMENGRGGEQGAFWVLSYARPMPPRPVHLRKCSSHVLSLTHRGVSTPPFFCSGASARWGAAVERGAHSSHPGQGPAFLALGWQIAP